MLIGCTEKDKIFIFSPDRSKCVTVITIGDIRYVINGRHNSIPDSNFVKLDIGSVYKEGDALNVCWFSEEYEWDIVINKAIVLMNKLDNSRFKFSVELEKDKRGVPNERRFREKGCATVLLNRKVLSPDNQGAIIEK